MCRSASKMQTRTQLLVTDKMFLSLSKLVVQLEVNNPYLLQCNPASLIGIVPGIVELCAASRNRLCE